VPEFKLKRGGLQDRFLQSRAKIQIYGGGFGNGKTSGAIAKVLQLANDYPGSNILLSRSTYPKLNDTLRKEFLKWCPKEWIKSFPMSVNASNTCTLHNGTMLNFRYIQQQGKSEETTTSNLLSATYDVVVVDQMEDPEISHKDFLDLLGRLRGSAIYRGTDSSMPRTGPRWFVITLNPTRNWVYKELVAPLHHYLRTGEILENLLCVRDSETSEPKLDENGKPYLMIELFEGATYENAHNLDADFIQTLESAYQGQMKDRFLKGEWASYEGLVYPQFNEMVHMVSEERVKKYLKWLRDEEYEIKWQEGYDHGLTSPSCYLLSFIDHHGNVIVCDGYYKRDFAISEQFDSIRNLRRKWGAGDGDIYADPDIMRRKGARGEKISDLFWTDASLSITRADNGIGSGITKVGSYLNPRPLWKNPFTLDTPAPTLYFNNKLSFVTEEFSGYFWKRNSRGEREDKPQESDDHAMDALKYLLTDRPNASELKAKLTKIIPAWMKWHEQDVEDYGNYRR
jgi:hypothetical protein